MAVLKELTFESGVKIGSDAFTSAESSVVIGTTDPILGTYYAQFPGNLPDNHYQAIVDFGVDIPNVYTAFYFKVVVNSTDLLNPFFNLSTSGGDYFIRLQLTSTRAIRLYDSSTSLGETDPLELGETYRIEIERLAAVSGDGIVRFYLAKGNAPSELQFETLTQLTTNGVRRVIFRHYLDSTLHFDVDQITFDNASMPTLTALPASNHEADVQFDLGFGIEQSVTHEADVQFEFGLLVDATTNLVHAADVQFDFVIELNADAKGIYVADVQFDFGIALRDNYTGPGTGVVTTGDGFSINDLVHGDTFNIYSPLAGIEGISGPAHVNSRTSREDIDEQELVLTITPQPDPTLIPALAAGEIPSITPTEEQNFATKMKKQDREIRKLKRT